MDPMNRNILTLLTLGAFGAMIVSCSPTPAEQLEIEKLRQDSIALVEKQQLLDSVAAAAMKPVETVLIDTLPTDSTPVAEIDTLNAIPSDTVQIETVDTTTVLN